MNPFTRFAVTLVIAFISRPVPPRPVKGPVGEPGGSFVAGSGAVS